MIPRLLDKSEIFGLREEFLAALIRFVPGDFSFGKYADYFHPVNILNIFHSVNILNIFHLVNILNIFHPANVLNIFHPVNILNIFHW